MSFHTLDFVAFLLLVTVVYWRLSHNAQNWFLLGASYLFYGWIHPWFCLLLATTTLVDWFAARRMQAQPDRRRRWLVLSLVANLGMLGFFKYWDFFIENVGQALDALGIGTSMPVLRVVLPVGISFYTFQSLSYTIDVYRGRLAATPSLRDFALFV
jgi:alginate O-acetyltransferase complex protein AlgI